MVWDRRRMYITLFSCYPPFHSNIQGRCFTRATHNLYEPSLLRHASVRYDSNTLHDIFLTPRSWIMLCATVNCELLCVDRAFCSATSVRAFGLYKEMKRRHRHSICLGNKRSLELKNLCQQRHAVDGFGEWDLPTKSTPPWVQAFERLYFIRIEESALKAI
jgi:hypothetical protein